MSTLHILWDEAFIWGLLLVRAAKAMGLSYKLVRGVDIAEGMLEREQPAMLVVPGGNARHKAENLGRKGVDSIRAYVAQGGRYLGFCGGAGLALSWQDGLSLCPWQRAGFDDRLQHFMSGHLRMRLPSEAARQAMPDDARGLIPPSFGFAPSLPVWWPGRFEAVDGSGVTVLATYQSPAEDFWLADLPTAGLPPDIFSTWQDLYGLSLSPTFLQGQPCIIHGEFGKGTYTLSYSHLETPVSPDANRWLAHLLTVLGGFAPQTDLLPSWHLRFLEGAAWDDADLIQAETLLHNIMQVGMNHNLLFQRNDWLMGWRTGIPGANLNNLWGAVKTIREFPPTDAALTYLEANRDALRRNIFLFHAGCTHYLLAERLAVTLAKSLPEALPPQILKEHRAALFGPPMQAGGIYKEVISVLDELAFLQMRSSA